MNLRFRRRFVVGQIAILMIGTLIVGPASPVDSATYPCGVVGKDGSATLSAAGTPNTYWAGSGSPVAGATTITLGTRNSGGSSQLLNTGDMILIMQMQGAVFNSTNSNAYGGAQTTGGGYASYTAGTYEFAVVRSASNADAGSTVTIASANGGGLVNSYTTAAASTSTGAAGTAGINDWQIVRVPQYRNFTVNANLLTAPWNGSSGGVIALDVAGTLTLSKPIDADGYGFRGGGQEIATGQLNNTYNNTTFDYAYTPMATSTSGPYVREDGYKGEGIAGSPTLIYQSGASATASSGTAYPGGNKGRGAPGNGGGGASENLQGSTQNNTSGIPGENYKSTVGNYYSYNTGGAGGGNGGAGGLGGYGYDNVNNNAVGDLGATAFVLSATTSAGTSPSGTAGLDDRAIGGVAMTNGITGKIVMGGGGGAGGNNDGTAGSGTAAVQLQPGLSGGATFTTTTTTASSGASGGGIIFLRVGTLAGGTLSAQGISAPDPNYDGGGGGGAGGTIVVVGNSVSGVTALAQGGRGACSTGGCGASSQFSDLLHGTGGGGGGGSVIYSGTVTATVTGGGPGLTAPSAAPVAYANFGTNSGQGSPYGATTGSTGTTSSGATLAQVIGARSGAECVALLLAKRVTLVNGASPSPGPAATYVPDGYVDTNTGQIVDANPSWPLIGGNPAILGIGVTSPPAPTAYSASVAPGGTLEYTVYFLSAGGKAVSMTGSGATTQGICDFLPANTSIVTNGYGAGKPMQVTIGFASPTTTTYGTVTAQGQTGYYPIVGGTPTIAIPTVCGSVPTSSTGLVFFNQATINPYATADGGYGKMQFTVTQN